jgi:DNA-binding transcriptional ArsR family regulator
MIKDKQMLRKIFEMQCEICKAVAHPLRLEIVEHLSKNEMGAGALLAALGTSKANLSKHTTQLIRAGIVDLRRDGRKAYYRLTNPEIHEACSIMRSILYRRLKRDEELASAIRPTRMGRGRSKSIS